MYIRAITKLHYNPQYKKIMLHAPMSQCQYTCMYKTIVVQTGKLIDQQTGPQTYRVHPHPAFPPLLDLQLLAPRLDSGYYLKEALVTGGGREGEMEKGRRKGERKEEGRKGKRGR